MARQSLELPATIAAEAPDTGAFARILLAAGALAACLLVLPNAYVQVVEWSGGRMVAPLYPHILANCLANLIVIVAGPPPAGRLDEKITRAAKVVLAAHGLLALTIVMTHSFHSNRVMIAAVLVSSVFGLCSAIYYHWTQRPRIAVIGPRDSLAEQIPPYAERLVDPRVDLRRYDVILIATDELPAPWTRSVSRALLAGRSVRHSAEYLEDARGLVSLDHFDLDQLREGGLGAYRSGKRLLDICLVVLMAPIAAPLLLGAIVAMLATMGRPIFFVQARTGRAGRPFNIIKLRTMRLASETAVQTTGLRDDRVTPLGRWLRKSRIDELPQLWNVLIGEMSFIGPRPEWTALAERYVDQIPAYAYRHLVRPGITGWAQVRSGYAADVRETRLKLAYDLFYVKNLSFALDVQILLRTVGALLTAWGAR